MTTSEIVAYVLIDVVIIVAAARLLGSLMRFVGQPVVVVAQPAPVRIPAAG